MSIELISKIAPKNDGFTGMVDADQVLGGGGSGTLPDACVAESSVTQHEAAIDHDELTNTHDLEGTSILSTGPATDGYVLTADGAGGAAWEEASGGVAAHALLDGDVHTDSAADDVSRGSIIVGNATPAWDELAVGTDGQVLQTDGTDVAWHTLVEADIDDLGAYIENIIEDTSPQLGADLDCNTYDITGVVNIESTGNITINAQSAATSYLYLKNTGAGALYVQLETDAYLAWEAATYIRRSASNTIMVRGSTKVLLSSDTLVESSASHQMDAGVVLPTDKKITFRDSDIFLHSNADGELTIEADTLTTIGVAGDISIGVASEAAERTLYPLDTEMWNLGDSSHQFEDLYCAGDVIKFANLPSSDPSVPGVLYHDSGTVKVSLA